jgi:RNA polymerase sigma-70 factor (ECF subfamily)
MAPTDTIAAEIFERHHIAVFRFFRRLTGRTDLAEDLTQEVFLRVVRGGEQYRVMGRETGWLFQIARRVLIDHHRQLSATTVSLSDTEPDQAVGPPAQLVAFGLQEAVSRLPDGERAAFLLREVGGLTYGEIANVCDTTEDGVSARLYRARARLRQLLSTRLAFLGGPRDQRGTE